MTQREIKGALEPLLNNVNPEMVKIISKCKSRECITDSIRMYLPEVDPETLELCADTVINVIYTKERAKRTKLNRAVKERQANQARERQVKERQAMEGVSDKTSVDPDGIVTRKWMNRNKVLHRRNGPALVITYPDGTKQEEWYINGENHRLDGPAIQTWYPNGIKKTEMWMMYGRLHRLDGPADLSWDANGNIISEDWYIADEHYSSRPSQKQIDEALLKWNSLVEVIQLLEKSAKQQKETVQTTKQEAQQAAAQEAQKQEQLAKQEKLVKQYEWNAQSLEQNDIDRQRRPTDLSMSQQLLKDVMNGKPEVQLDEEPGGERVILASDYTSELASARSMLNIPSWIDDQLLVEVLYHLNSGTSIDPNGIKYYYGTITDDGDVFKKGKTQ